MPSTVVLPLLFAVASSPLICVPVPPLVMVLSPSFYNRLVAVIGTDGLRIGNGHGALVSPSRCHRCIIRDRRR
ncbi:hypothetical protein QT318_17355 [Escherichia coli]|nr:hypothetical protein [Escherichia coli]